MLNAGLDRLEPGGGFENEPTRYKRAHQQQ